MATSALGRIPAILEAIAPLLSVAARTEWADAFVEPMTKAQITTPHRIGMILGQTGEETGGFTVFDENLHYSRYATLHAAYGSRYFPTPASALPYIGQPQKLANYVYAGREGNGNAASDDGWRFRGGGPMQLTFRAAYAKFGETVGRTAEEAADYVRTVVGGAESTCWFWTERKVNPLADAWNVPGVTKLINGGEVNLKTRKVACYHALQVALA